MIAAPLRVRCLPALGSPCCPAAVQGRSAALQPGTAHLESQKPAGTAQLQPLPACALQESRAGHLLTHAAVLQRCRVSATSLLYAFIHRGSDGMEMTCAKVEYNCSRSVQTAAEVKPHSDCAWLSPLLIQHWRLIGLTHSRIYVGCVPVLAT